MSTLGPTVAQISKMPVDQAQAALSDRTVMSFDAGATYCVTYFKYPTCTTEPGHGTQIEYFAATGENFLWYPGNTRPVFGVWKLQRDGKDTRYLICFRYQSNSYNPLTRQRGGSWDCRPFGPYVAGLTEVRNGDIFRLSGGELPFPLERSATTFDELLAKINTKAPPKSH